MALGGDDVARSLRGSIKMMRGSDAALSDLDLTRDGLSRSFEAYLLTLPALVALIAGECVLRGRPGALFADVGLTLSVVAASCLTVILVPALLLALRPQLAADAAFGRFVIGWNWAGVINLGLIAVPATLLAIGWSNPPLAMVQATAFVCIGLRLRYCVARAALGADRGVALLVAAASLIGDYALLRLFGLAGF